MMVFGRASSNSVSKRGRTANKCVYHYLHKDSRALSNFSV